MQRLPAEGGRPRRSTWPVGGGLVGHRARRPVGRKGAGGPDSRGAATTSWRRAPGTHRWRRRSGAWARRTVTTTWLRRERPYSVMTEGRFADVRQLAAAIMRDAGAQGDATLVQERMRHPVRGPRGYRRRRPRSRTISALDALADRPRQLPVRPDRRALRVRRWVPDPGRRCGGGAGRRQDGDGRRADAGPGVGRGGMRGEMVSSFIPFDAFVYAYEARLALSGVFSRCRCALTRCRDAAC